MKSIKEIEKLSVEELERIGADENIPVPGDLSVKIPSRKAPVIVWSAARRSGECPLQDLRLSKQRFRKTGRCRIHI